MVYHGDNVFAELLQQLGVTMRLPEIRARIMRGLWGLRTEAPGEVMEEILDGLEIQDEQVGDFSGQFLALWNELSQHLEVNRPFRLFQAGPLKRHQDLAAWIHCRAQEVKQLKHLFLPDKGVDSRFMAGIQELSQRMVEAAGEFDELITRLDEAHLKKNLAAGMIKKCREVDRSFEAIFNQAGQMHKSARAKLFRHAASRASAARRGSGRRIRRDDPCFCGSGKKFKDCCLQ